MWHVQLLQELWRKHYIRGFDVTIFVYVRDVWVDWDCVHRIHPPEGHVYRDKQGYNGPKIRSKK